MSGEKVTEIGVEAMLERGRLLASISFETKARYGIVDDFRPVELQDDQDKKFRMWTLQVPEVADIVLILFDDPEPGSRPLWRIGAIRGKSLAERSGGEIEDFYAKVSEIKTHGRRVTDEELDWHLQTALFDAQKGGSVLSH
jgi:hypothetical protein